MASVIRFPLQVARAKSQDDRWAESKFQHSVLDYFRNTTLPAGGDTFDKTVARLHNVQAAAKDPTLSLNNNHGHPTVAATAHPAQFKGQGVIAAHGDRRPAIGARQRRGAHPPHRPRIVR